MSIYLKPNELKIKNEQGQYVGLNIAAEGSVQDYLDAIEAKGLETIDNIPSDYTTLSEEVDDLRDDVDGIIDNTLTQTSKAADAKKTGDEISLLKNGQLTGSSLTFNKGTADETTITAAQLATLVSLTSAEGVNF